MNHHSAPRRESAKLDGTTDAELCRRIEAGDIEALGALYDRHVDSIHRFVSRALPSEDAEDVVQDTFARVARIAGSFDGRDPSAKSWLFGVASRVLRERRRSFARFSRALERVWSTRETSSRPGGREAELDTRADLTAALAGLSDSKRMVLLLCDAHGFTGPEVAEMLEIPVGTVWTRLHHARKEMIQRLGGRDGDM